MFAHPRSPGSDEHPAERRVTVLRSDVGISGQHAASRGEGLELSLRDRPEVIFSVRTGEWFLG
jgi:hypothetical protein